MPMTNDAIDSAPIDVPQQFQSDAGFRQEWHASSPGLPAKEHESLVDLGDISLAMRQFYQSPARTAG